MNSWVPGAWDAYLQKSCRELRTSALHLEMPHVAAIVDPGGAEIQGKLTLKIPILARFPKIECSPQWTDTTAKNSVLPLG